MILSYRFLCGMQFSVYANLDSPVAAGLACHGSASKPVHRQYIIDLFKGGEKVTVYGKEKRPLSDSAHYNSTRGAPQSMIIITDYSLEENPRKGVFC